LRFGLRRLCAWMMVVLCCGSTLSAIVARAADDDLVKQLKELSEKLSPTPNNDAPLDPKVQEALEKLLRAIHKFDCTRLRAPEECAEAINALVNLYAADPTKPAAPDAKKAAQLLIQIIQKRLTDELKKDKDIADALADILPPTPPKPTPLLINVLGAYYGGWMNCGICCALVRQRRLRSNFGIINISSRPCRAA
jgi:hypothetical protein